MWTVKVVKLASVLTMAALAIGYGLFAYPVSAAAPAGTKRKADYSHPKKTLLAFCAAVRAGNLEALKDCSIRPNAKTRRFWDATAHYAIAQHRFHAAASAKFGDDRLWHDIIALLAKGANDAEVRMDGDSATLRIKEDGTTMTFKKEGKAWKYNLIDLDEDAFEMVKPAELARAAREMDEDAKTYERLTTRIENGKLKTAEELKRATGEELQPRAFFSP